MISKYDDFKKEVVAKYQKDYGCGQDMSVEEIQREFDMIIGKHGYDEICRVCELCKKRGEPYDPVESACDQMDSLI